MKTTHWLVLLSVACLGSAVVARGAETTVMVKEDRVNVRARPSLQGEVVTQLAKGETVTVLEELAATPKPKPGEPAKWLKIAMPANTPVWVNAAFIDPESKTVKPNRLNVRGGPGENYSVIGRLERGASVKSIRVNGDWMEIETPTGVFGYVAAMLVEPAKAEAAPATPPPAPAERPPTAAAPAAAVSAPVAEPAPTPSPSPAPAPSSSTPQAAALPPSTTDSVATPPARPSPSPRSAAQPGPWSQVGRTASPSAPAGGAAAVVRPAPGGKVVPPPTNLRLPGTAVGTAPAKDDPPPKRVVSREGLVRGTASIQAPTFFELESVENGQVLNYLNSEKLGISLKNFRGRKVLVTGEEKVDTRWPNTPVIDLETLRLID